MLLLNASGVPENTTIELRTRKNRAIDNLQPWSYSALEWKLLESGAWDRYEKAGAKRVGAHCPVYNCHGLTFGNRRTQVKASSDIIAMILDDDGFVELKPANPEEGDIVVYYDSRGLPEHSGVVIGIGPDPFKIPKIWSKWGKDYQWIHNVGVCPYDASNVRYYRITKWKYEEVFTTSS